MDGRAVLQLDEKTLQELAEQFGRPVDLLTRRGMESSPNRLRREAILFSAQVVHAA